MNSTHNHLEEQRTRRVEFKQLEEETERRMDMNIVNTDEDENGGCIHDLPR